MFRITLLAVMAVGFIAQSASAQIFPRAPWNRTAASDDCPGGQCPTANTTAGGRWTYPGTIKSHLATDHGIDPSGMTREQMLSTHDALHEGRTNYVEKVAPRPTYAAAAYSTSYGSTGSSAKSYGSCGSGFAVGKPDYDGAIIASIGSTVSPEIAKVGSGTVQPLAIGDRVKFRRALLTAAKQAREDGTITPAQYLLLSMASRSPKALDQMQAAVHEAAIEEGLATTQAIDWDALISFIEKLIPIIIQLIDLFS